MLNLLRSRSNSSLKDLFKILQKEEADFPDDKSLLSEVKDWFSFSKKTGHFCLRHHTVEPYPKSRMVSPGPVFYMATNQ